VTATSVLSSSDSASPPFLRQCDPGIMLLHPSIDKTCNYQCCPQVKGKLNYSDGLQVTELPTYYLSLIDLIRSYFIRSYPSNSGPTVKYLLNEVMLWFSSRTTARLQPCLLVCLHLCLHMALSSVPLFSPFLSVTGHYHWI
jgi:hypothetical protein